MREYRLSAVLLFVALFCGAIASSAGPGGTAEVVPVRLRTTSANDMGIRFYNTGMIGNNLESRSPSMEFPLRSDQEHLIRGGIWVGGVLWNDTTAVYDTLVSTASIDGVAGSFDPKQASEFTPADTITERSTLRDNRNYDPFNARSEQDFLFSYTDPKNLNPAHKRPLGIKVNVETLAWSMQDYKGFVIVNYQIVNLQPSDTIRDMYVGMYAELASGYKGNRNPWNTSGWFSKKDIDYVDSLRLVTEHHYQYDANRCPSWGGIQLLGTRSRMGSDSTVSFNWWNWSVETPNTDPLRYAKLSRHGDPWPTNTVEAPNSDPVELISIGPFPMIEPGDTVKVSFAFLGGLATSDRTALEDIIYKARLARKAFWANFKIPLPPPSPSLHVVPRQGKLSLWWDKLSEDFIDPRSRVKDFEGYRVYVSEQKEDVGFRMIRQFDKVDTLLENTGMHEIDDGTVQVFGDDTCRYHLDIDHVKDGFKYWVSVTSFDTGTVETPPMESGTSQNRTFSIPSAGSAPIGQVKVFPNPYRGDAAWDGSLARDRYLWFANLPPRCTIKIFTLSGDLVDTIEFDSRTYKATEIRGIYDPTDVHNPELDTPTLGGGMAAWDLVTRRDQGVATGLYLFSVKDHDTGKTQLGKFLILK
jgi:hypothetical protein